MAYDNHSNKATFLKKTGSEIINSSYKVDISSLLDSSSRLGSTVTDQDEIVVVRKFDHSTISPATTITADEAWSLWTLPNANNSGSSMYSLSGTQITFSETASDYTWTTAQSGRDADLTIPTIASGDTVYILRKTYSLSKFVEWAQGSKITSKNLNMQADQAMYINQELLQLFFNMHSLNPAVGQAGGVCPLNASGTIASTYIDGDSLGIESELGVQGAGTSSDKLRTKLDGDSLAAGTDGVKVDTVNNLTTDSSTKPLSAAQGKVLNDSITSLGAGIVYKGGFDVKAARTGANDPAAGGSLVAGWTITHTGTTGSPHGNWSGLTGSIAQYTLCRYDGSNWDVVSSADSLLKDGSVPLDSSATLTTTAGTVLVATQSTNDNSTKAASTGYVAQEIAATVLSELSDVDTDHAVANGDIIKRVSGEWVFVAPSEANGISLNDLNNVTGTNSGGKILQYVAESTNAWEVTPMPTALRSTQTLVDENTTTHTQVQSAFDGSSFGWLTDGAKSSTTVRVLNGANLSYACTDELTLRDAADREIKDITLNYTVNNAKENFLLTNGAGGTFDGASRAYSTNLTSEVTMGATRIPVANGEAAKFKVGAAVAFKSAYSSATDAATKTNTWATVLPTQSTASFDTDVVQSFYANDAGYEIVDLESTASGTEYIYIDKPLDHDLLGTSTIYTFGTDGSGSTSERECRDLTFENVTFKDTLAQTFYTADTGSSDGSTYGGNNNPITVEGGSTDNLKIYFPASHGMAAGSGFRIEDSDMEAKISGSIYTTVNRTHEIESVSTNFITFDNPTGAIAGSSDVGGGSSTYVIISKHSGLKMQGVHKLVFRNCTFDGWNKYAVYLQACKDVLFENCTFKNCRGEVETVDGETEPCIMLYGGEEHPYANSNVVVRGCRFINCGVGIGSDAPDTGNNAASKVNNAAVKNLTVEDCTFNCQAPINMLRACDGLVTVRNCVFTAVTNYKRDHLGLVGDAIYLGAGVNEATIEGNTIEDFKTMVNSGAHGDYSATAFYDKGDKWEKLNANGEMEQQTYGGDGPQNDFENKTLKYPAFDRGIVILTYKNPHKLNNTGYGLINPNSNTPQYNIDVVAPPTANQRVKVNNNNVYVWGRNALLIEPMYNTALEDASLHQWMGNWQINNNSFTACKNVIQIQHRNFMANWRAVVDTVKIAGNVINIDRIAEKFPTRWKADGYNEENCLVGTTQSTTHWCAIDAYSFDNNNTYNNTQQVTACSCLSFETGAARTGHRSLVRFANVHFSDNYMKGANFNDLTSGCIVSLDINSRTIKTSPVGSETAGNDEISAGMWGINGHFNWYEGGVVAWFAANPTHLPDGTVNTANQYSHWNAAGCTDSNSLVVGGRYRNWFPASRTESTGHEYPWQRYFNYVNDPYRGQYSNSKWYGGFED